MAAYVIADTRILDRELVAQYRALSAAAVAKYGGTFLVRGGAIETVEGDWSPEYIAILEFPDMERARAWYESAEYAKALEVRAVALDRQLIFIEGVQK